MEGTIAANSVIVVIVIAIIIITATLRYSI